MRISEIRKEAREALKGKWGKGALVVAAYLVTMFIFGFISGFFNEESIIGVILSMVEVIISVPLNLALAFIFIKLKRGEDIKAFQFIDIAIDNFSKAWKIIWRTALKMIWPIIVLIVTALIYIGIVVYSTMQLAIGGVETISAAIVVGAIIYFIAMLYFVSVSLLYSLTSFVAYDNQEMTASEIVEKSANLMKGNRCKIVLLELSFIGWAILTAFTFGIGYIWLLPYMMVALVCFYEKLIQNENGLDNTTNEEEPIKNL